jgi:hypothetical protein
LSRSIHKTVAQVTRQNSKRELAAPDNPDIAELAKKIRYKKLVRTKRKTDRQKSPSDSISPEDG